MSVGLALIAKDEEERLPGLLESIEGAFDQVILVDTGSTDRTTKVFKDWARKQENLEWKCERFKWVQDFAAARTYAHSLLDTDWEVWADCDDTIVGAQNLRAVAASAPEEVAAFVAGYNYAQHPVTGAPVCYLRRERMVRKGMAKWVNRVHEAQVVEGPVQVLDRGVVEWVHRKQATSVERMQKEDADRNLLILDEWVKDDPQNTRVLAYLGTERAAKGDIDIAINWFNLYFAANPEWDEERAQVHRKVATCYLFRGEFPKAIDTAFEAMKVMPSWTDSYLTLAEAYFSLGDFPKAVEWAQEALRRGEPQTMLIINPLDYTFGARKVLAGALGELKQYDEAIRIGQEALQAMPSDEGLVQAVQMWRGAAKLEHTANTIAMLAQQLIAHDEQLRALTLLSECVPHFALDHPGIVNLRSMLRERIDWIHDPEALLKHYEDGGSKPEDFLPDDQLDTVAAALPRSAFLYEGIYDQLLEALHNGMIDDAQDQVDAALKAMGVELGHVTPDELETVHAVHPQDASAVDAAILRKNLAPLGVFGAGSVGYPA